jgi:hypothetical protein
MNKSAIAPDAWGAAEVYLRDVGATATQYPKTVRAEDGRKIVTTWEQVLRDTAEAIQEEGLIHQYAGSRFARKRRAYREARQGQTPRKTAQNRRSEGTENGGVEPGSTGIREFSISAGQRAAS